VIEKVLCHLNAVANDLQLRSRDGFVAVPDPDGIGTNVLPIRADGRMPAAPGDRHAGTVADESEHDPDAREHGLIVVGVDGSAGAAAALDFALAEGRRRGCPVEVVTAWLGSGHLDGTSDSDDLTEARARVHRMQDDVLDRCLAAHSDAPRVGRVVVHDYAGRVLVARAERASMVVVGSGSPSRTNHQLLGSVAEYCVRHAPVPVVIVPPPARLERRTSVAVQAV
jgi:nucleotide-binding universal stress UspA family protein